MFVNITIEIEFILVYNINYYEKIKLINNQIHIFVWGF